MPVDADGTRADIIVDPCSRSNRMIPGSVYEQYINSASVKAKRVLSNMFNLPTTAGKEDAELAISCSNPTTVQQACDYLLGYYDMFAPIVYNAIKDDYNTRVYDLQEVLGSGLEAVQLFMPCNNPISVPLAIKECESHPEYRPTYGPVKYTGNSGVECITRSHIRIGSLYYILLEKVADDWSAVSSGRTQLLGVPGQTTATDKYSTPVVQKSVRGTGEAEIRSFVAYAGTRTAAELLDRNNNPTSHKAILHTIHRAEHPTRIESAIDRSKYPLGGARPLQHLKHIGACAGWGIDYTPYKETDPKPKK